MNTLSTCENVGASVQYVAPEVNIVETPDRYLLQAEMPGVNKSGLEITLEGSEITILGRRTPEPAFEGEYLHRESRGLDYRRVFELDPAIDAAKISARVEQGILTVELPKAEKVKPRKVEITG